VDDSSLVTLTADIVGAHVANNTVAIRDIGDLVKCIHEALARLASPPEQLPPAIQPVVSRRASVKPGHLVCMACGKSAVTLRRHLVVAHQMTPDQYRETFGLAATYPVVAKHYSEFRSALAKSYGFGRNPGNRPVARKTGRKPAKPAKRGATSSPVSS